MNARCKNPKNVAYKYYGARGISVCAAWRDFAPFQGWSLANGYEEGLSIDRIDNDKGYEPSNCRWTTMFQQRHNRRR